MAQTERVQAATIAEGTPVQVRNRFEGSWARGFEVHAPGQAGYLVRRVSDGTVLPSEIAENDLRSELPLTVV